MSAITVSMGWRVVAEKLSLTTDRRGEVAGLRVERAMGVQGTPLSFQ